YGIIEGIDNSALERAASAPDREDILIATGLPPQNGEDAKIDYFFVSSSKEIKPLEVEGGRVDYREVFFIPFVNPGDLLARKTPSTVGAPGRTVTGKPIPPAPGKNFDLVAGKNVSLSDDKLEVTAKVGGQPFVEKSKISVTPLYTVQKDVDFSVGNIAFNGSVLIQGSILNGFSVKATGDIEVGGTVEGAKIEAGGRITIKGGVRAQSVIQAGQDVVIRFCDTNSKISCKRDLFIQDSSLHCDLVAGRRINIAKELIGGKSRAGEMVVTMVAGTSAGTATHIEIIQLKPNVLLATLKKQLAEIEEQMNALNKQCQELIIKKDKGALQKLTGQKITHQMRFNQLKAEIAEVETSPLDLDPPRIVIKGEAFPGTVVKINSLSHPIGEKRYACTFRISGGEIVG
ncbi:MAG TPA: FapA family protein, partial [Chroococcales cyanobacterium]